MTPSKEASIYLILLLLALYVIAIYVNYIFLESIDFNNIVHQPDYLIDAYMYMDLGNIIHSFSDNTSLFESILSVTPNNSSIGVVAISSFMAALQLPFVLYPLVFIIVYSLLVIKIYNRGVVSNRVFFIFIPLLPYLFITSKESILLIAGLFFLLAISEVGKARKGLFYFITLLFILSSRPETLFIIVLSQVMYYCFANRKWLFILLFVALFFYYELDHFVNEIAYSFQEKQLGKVGQCSYFGISVCLERENFDFLVYLKRLFLFLLIPFKYVASFVYFVNLDSNVLHVFILRLINLITCFAYIALAIHFVRYFKKLSIVQKRMFYFSMAYLIVYGTIFFYQGSRHMNVSITVLLLIFSLKKGRPYNV